MTVKNQNTTGPLANISLWKGAINNIRDIIVSHMMTNNLFCEEKHGFVPGSSCESQLLCGMEMWANSLNSRDEIDCIYLDVPKSL